MVVDNEKRVKVTEIVEGGYLDLGFTLYRVTFEVMEKEGKQKECIIKSTVEYEVKEEFAENAAFVSIQLFIDLMQTTADYLLNNYNN